MKNAELVLRKSFGKIIPERAAELVLVRLDTNVKYAVEFPNKTIYVMTTTSEIKLFAGNRYLGVLIIEVKDNEITMISNCYARGKIAVICGMPGEKRFDPIGNCSDLLMEYEAEKISTLRKHFQKEYYDLWTEEPEKWCDFFIKTKDSLKEVVYDIDKKELTFADA